MCVDSDGYYQEAVVEAASYGMAMVMISPHMSVSCRCLWK